MCIDAISSKFRNAKKRLRAIIMSHNMIMNDVAGFIEANKHVLWKNIFAVYVINLFQNITIILIPRYVVLALYDSLYFYTIVISMY